jgi:hypothetical protein
VLFGKTGDNPYCHHRAYELMQQHEWERIEKVSEAPGLPFDHGIFKIVKERMPDAEHARLSALNETTIKFVSGA